MFQRKIVALVIGGILLILLFPFSGKFIQNQVHADFLNPNALYLLPPTNVGMSAQIAGGKSMSTFHWTPSKNAVSYTIYSNDIQLARGITGNSYTVPSDTLNGNTTFTITSINGGGQESIPSNLATEISAYTDSTKFSWAQNYVPAVPRTITAVSEWNLGVPRVKLSWLGGGDAQAYNVYKDNQLVGTGLFDLIYVDSDITPGSTHSYAVTALNVLWPGTVESEHSASVSATALTAAPAFSQTPITVTKIIPEDDSVHVFFTPIPGATDYRAYALSNTGSVKYSGSQSIPADYEFQSPIPYSIQMNGLPSGGADLVVEAVDKLGPFQKADGFMGPGANLGISINGQGDPSNIPNVIARSLPFHVTTKPFALTGAQCFYDTFKNEPSLQDVPTSQINSSVLSSNNGNIYQQKNSKWTITGYNTDNLMTRSFFMSNHFMDTIYDGTPYTSSPAHNNNSSTVIQPNATADISGGKVLHVTMQVDGHFDGRRWTDIMVGEAGDPLLNTQSPDKVGTGYPTVSGNLLYWEINDGTMSLGMFEPDPEHPGQTKNIDLIQLPSQSDPNWFTDYISLARVGWNGYGVMNNGTAQDLDKRSTFDLYLSSSHYKIVETDPDGMQIVREKNFPSGVSLPFTQAQPYYIHELYHTGNDRPEQVQNSNGGNQYWYNYRPWSDERHWDNMGFEVLPTVASIPSTESLIPQSTSPTYADVTPTPGPTSSPEQTSYDLNSNVVPDLGDLILAIAAYNGSPNAKAEQIWPPSGKAKFGDLIRVITWLHSAK